MKEIVEHDVTTKEGKYAAALDIAQEIAEVSKTDDKLETILNATNIVCGFYQSGVHMESGEDYSTAYGVLIKGESSCAGVTRAMGMVLECLGYEWTHKNENQWSHQWCEFVLDSETYFVDAQAGFVGVTPHPYELQ